MSTKVIACPGCQNQMQVLQLESAEVDYCLFCGGAYFDVGEIETLVHHPLPLTESGRPAERSCPRCVLPMEPANLGTVPVDRCGSCAGLYLDTAELAPISRLDLEEEAARSTDSTSELKRFTTTCAGCGETFSPDLLSSTSRGLACGRCFGNRERGFASGVADYVATEGLADLLRFLFVW